MKYGARHLKRAIEHHLVQPLSGLLATGQIESGDTVTADVAENGEELLFTKINADLLAKAAHGTVMEASANL